jgi:hypothetical protein
MNNLKRYYDNREFFKTGDLLTYDTDGTVSWLIKRWSPGANHAGLVLALDEYEGEEHRRWTLEATAQGPRMAFLSGLLENLHGECYWHPLKPRYEQNRNAIGCWALEQQGVVKYDFRGILEYPFRKVSADLNRLWCSEYVQFSWAKGKIIAMVDGAPGAKPSDLPKFGVTLPPVLIVERKPFIQVPVVVGP